MMIAPILLLKRDNAPPLVIHKGEVIFYRRGGSTGFYSGGGRLDGFLSRTEGEINRHQQSTVEIRL